VFDVFAIHNYFRNCKFEHLLQFYSKTTLCTMNISKYEYCYNTDMLYNYGLKEIKPIVMTIPHHLSYV